MFYLLVCPSRSIMGHCRGWQCAGLGMGTTSSTPSWWLQPSWESISRLQHQRFPHVFFLYFVGGRIKPITCISSKAVYFTGLWAREQCNSRGAETLQGGEVTFGFVIGRLHVNRIISRFSLKSVSERDPVHADLWPDGGRPRQQCLGHRHLDQYGTGGRKGKEAERLSRFPGYNEGKKNYLMSKKWCWTFWSTESNLTL